MSPCSEMAWEATLDTHIGEVVERGGLWPLMDTHTYRPYRKDSGEAGRRARDGIGSDGMGVIFCHSIIWFSL